VIGRVPGTLADFNYSTAMQDYGAANGAWTEAAIATYLENPKAVIPGNKMAFIGLKKPEDRDNVIAYLKTNP
jgi:cytochrome c